VWKRVQGRGKKCKCLFGVIDVPLRKVDGGWEIERARLSLYGRLPKEQVAAVKAGGDGSCTSRPRPGESLPKGGIVQQDIG